MTITSLELAIELAKGCRAAFQRVIDENKRLDPGRAQYLNARITELDEEIAELEKKKEDTNEHRDSDG